MVLSSSVLGHSQGDKRRRAAAWEPSGAPGGRGLPAGLVVPRALLRPQGLLPWGGCVTATWGHSRAPPRAEGVTGQEPGDTAQIPGMSPLAASWWRLRGGRASLGEGRPQPRAPGAAGTKELSGCGQPCPQQTRWREAFLRVSDPVVLGAHGPDPSLPALASVAQPPPQSGLHPDPPPALVARIPTIVAVGSGASALGRWTDTDHRCCRAPCSRIFHVGPSSTRAASRPGAGLAGPPLL